MLDLILLTFIVGTPLWLLMFLDYWADCIKKRERENIAREKNEMDV